MKKINILLCGLILLSACGQQYKNNPDPTESSNPVISVVDIPIPTSAPITQPDFETNWSLGTVDGNASLSSTYLSQTVNINHPGTVQDGVQLFHDGVPLVRGAAYQLSFDIHSTLNRPIQFFVANNDTGVQLLNQTITVTEESTHYEVSLSTGSQVSWNGRIGFNLGAASAETYMDAHSITVENLSFTETGTRHSEPNIKINQTGYLPNSQKKIVFPYDQGDYFQVINVDTQEVVYTAPIVGKNSNESTKETTFYGDFSEVTAPGKYRIQAQIAGTSHDFTIQEDLYHNVLDSAVRMLTLQRCGTELTADWAGALAHRQCHHQDATVYGTDQTLDVSGGWHDAGDYGRYTATGVKTVTDLMLAYRFNPSLFTDDIGIPESGNEVPDLLDEARYELEWLMKMQNDWGGVYDKVVTAQLPGSIKADEDQGILYVMPELTTVTGGFVGAMALAYTTYKDIDPQFAETCLKAAEKSWEYLQGATLTPYENPEDFSAGIYKDEQDIDERYFASASLYAATQNPKYLDNAKAIFTASADLLHGLEWKNTGTYGTYLLLKSETLKTQDSAFYSQLLAQLISEAESVLNATANDSYFVSLYTSYVWGSNSLIANNGILLAMADDLRPNTNYVNASADHLHYLMGRNSLNTSFITGTGIHSPVHLHHRPSISGNTILSGALVGGPNASLEDAAVQSLFNAETPVAKCYVDSYDSYSTNEVAIYWNSPLIALLSVVEKAN